MSTRISISGWGVNRTYSLNVWEESYDPIKNTSVVGWQVISEGDSTGYDYYLKATVNGTTVYNSSGGWGYNFPSKPGWVGDYMTVSHGSDGKKTVSMYIEGYAYTYRTISKSGSHALTNIDRTAPTIEASAASNITVSSFNITASSNVTCNQWAYRIKKSGGSYPDWTGWANVEGTSHTFSVTGLANNTTYVIQLAGHKKYNYVYGFSSEITVKTLGASTISSVSNTMIGNSCAVTWTPLNSSFRFKIKYSCGSWSYTTDYISPNRTSAYTHNYTIPMTVCNQIPNSTTGTLTAVLTTYTGSTQVGSSSSKTATLTVPSSVVPTISSVSLTEGTESGFGVFTKSLSTVKSTTSALGAYSSTIKSIVMTVDGKSYTASSNVATSDIFQTSGTFAVKVVATDSRGRTATNTQNITVYDYFRPTISIENTVGSTTVVTTISGKIAPVNDLNTKKLVVTRKKLSDDSTTTFTVDPITSYDYSEKWTQTISDIDTETYLYTATVTDKKQSVTISRQTAIVCISRLRGGNGVTLFKEATNEGFWVRNIDYTISDSEYAELDNIIGSW